jgi:hypothetical protein
MVVGMKSVGYAIVQHIAEDQPAPQFVLAQLRSAYVDFADISCGWYSTVLCKCLYTSVYTANETLAMFVQHLHRPWAALLKQGSDAVAHLMAHVAAL